MKHKMVERLKIDKTPILRECINCGYEDWLGMIWTEWALQIKERNNDRKMC